MVNPSIYSEDFSDWWKLLLQRCKPSPQNARGSMNFFVSLDSKSQTSSRDCVESCFVSSLVVVIVEVEVEIIVVIVVNTSNPTVSKPELETLKHGSFLFFFQYSSRGRC